MLDIDAIPRPHTPVDVAPFGSFAFWTGDSPDTLECHLLEARAADDGSSFWLPAVLGGDVHLGLEWEEPGDFSKVVVRYRTAEGMPSPKQVRLQYWNHSWPQPNHGGWTSVEDSYHGRWITVHDHIHIEGSVWTHTFDPLDIAELERAGDHPVRFRRARKLRLLFRDARPEIASIAVYTDSLWQEQTACLLLGAGIAHLCDWSGRVEVYHGYPLEVDSDHFPVSGLAWKGRTEGQPAPIRLRFLASDADVSSARRTIVTLRMAQARCQAGIPLWPGPEIRYRIATGDPPDFREREGSAWQEVLKGYLPVVATCWEDRGIAYTQEVFATLLLESPGEEDKKRGDEPAGLLMRLEARNMR